MMLFSRTNPRSKRRGRATAQQSSNGAKRDTKSSSASRGSGGSSGSNKSSSLTLSLPPTIKRRSTDDACSCSSTASTSSRTVSTATASTVTTDTKKKTADGGPLDTQRRRGQHNGKNNGPVKSLDHYLALNNPQQVNIPSPLSQSSRSHSSDESHDSSISSWQRHPTNSNVTNTSCVTSTTRGDPINHLENEVAKLSAALKQYRKYTPEWFVLDTKLSAAKEELEAVREDRDLDFLDMNDPLLVRRNHSVTNGGLGVPETVLVRSDEVDGDRPIERSNIDESQGTTNSTSKMSATQQEYQEAVQKLNKVDKFSDEWFLLQEQVIELRNKVMEEAIKPTLASAGDSPSEVDNSTLPSLADDDREQNEPAPYLMPVPLSRALSDTRPTHHSKNFYPAPYHERSSSLPSDSLAFVPSRRSMSPPLHMRCSPPSSPLTSRNLFPSSASINSSLYSQNDDDDEEETGSRLFSSMPQEDEQLAKLRSEYTAACLELESLPQFSKEWFELKTKTVNLEEQLENQENGSLGGVSHLSYGGVADRSSAAWSEEDDEIMSFASDLELCMIGEALKQGNCVTSPFGTDDFISPIGDVTYCDEDDSLMDGCEFPDFAANYEKEYASAIRIQSQWKQYHRSKAYKSMVLSAIKVQAFVRCKLQLSKYKQQKQRTKVRSHTLFSVSTIQSAFARRKFHKKSDESNSALYSSQSPDRLRSVLIQHERTKLLHILKAAICIQSFIRMKQQQKNFKLLANVILIQSVVRGRLARRQVNEYVSRSILQDQDSVHSKSRSQNSPSAHNKSSVARPSVEVIQSHHRALSLRRSQLAKFSNEWFYTTELLQGLEHELHIRQREQQNASDGNASDGHMSMEDSRHEDDLSSSSPSTRDASMPCGYVMQMVQSIERQQTSSLQSSPDRSICSWTNFSRNEFSPKNANPTEEENLKRLGKECIRLARELEELPRFSDEWFQCKVELKSATEELELLYEMNRT